MIFHEEKVSASRERMERFVSYLRVSTNKQGMEGLGIDAQRKAIAVFLNGGRKSVAEFVEVESGRKDENRPKLQEALAACRTMNATLIVARLDRLTRDAHFLLGLQKSGAKFIAADLPEVNEMVVGILGVIAQYESKLISERTKAAMAAAKARGQKFGGNFDNFTHARRVKGGVTAGRLRQEAATQRAVDLAPAIEAARERGIVSLSGLAREMDQLGHRTSKGGAWTATTIKNLLAIIDGKDTGKSYP